MVDGKSLCGEEQVGVSVDDDGVPGGGAQGGQACPHHPPSSGPCCLHPCCRPGNLLERDTFENMIARRNIDVNVNWVFSKSHFSGYVGPVRTG